MKKGDKYVGKTSGSCLVITDIKGSTYELECERRLVDKRTGELILEKRTRTVNKKDMPFVLAGYTKA